MKLRFWPDPETGQPHIHGHGVTEQEVLWVLTHPGDTYPGGRNSRIVMGQTEAGRLIKVVYVPDQESDSGLVVTAYEVAGKTRKAYRRRRRRRG